MKQEQTAGGTPGTNTPPGGEIGDLAASSRGTLIWTRAADPRHEPDRDLACTTIRWDDGWYVVTAPKGLKEATRREGPFTDMTELAAALYETVDGREEPRPGSGPGRPGGNGSDPPPGESKDYGDDVHVRIDEICAEGYAVRLRAACRRWLAELEVEEQDRARTGQPAPRDIDPDERLGVRGDRARIKTRRALSDIYDTVGDHIEWADK